MADKVTVAVTGLSQLIENARGLTDEIRRRIARSMTGTAAKRVKFAAVQNIERSPSIHTGSLHDAVIVKRNGKTKLTSEHLVTVRRRKTGNAKTQAKQHTAPHARYVEFGTVNMPAEPFLGPALSNNVDRCIEDMRSTGERRIRQATNKLKKARSQT